MNALDRQMRGAGTIILAHEVGIPVDDIFIALAMRKPPTQAKLKALLELVASARRN